MGDVFVAMLANRKFSLNCAWRAIKEDGMNSLLIDLDRNPRYDQRKREILEDLSHESDRH
jgi:hypothetical protein